MKILQTTLKAITLILAYPIGILILLFGLPSIIADLRYDESIYHKYR